MAIFDLGYFAGHVIEGMTVWRYLFSPVYRAVVHERWRGQSRFETGLDMFDYSLGFIFVTLVVAGLGWLIISAISGT